MVNDAAYFLGIPYVWGFPIYRFDGQASVFAPTLADDALCYRCLPPSPRRRGWSPAAPRAACSASRAPRSARIQVNEAIVLTIGGRWSAS